MYISIDTMKTALSTKAKTILTYMSNTSDNTSLSVILSNFLDTGIAIITKWKKLKSEDEFLSGDYDTELIDFAVNSHNQLVGFNEKVVMTAESILKASLPQRI